MMAGPIRVGVAGIGRALRLPTFELQVGVRRPA